jgi:hypothetical protein
VTKSPQAVFDMNIKSCLVRRASCAVLLFSLTLCASADDFGGSWKALFTGDFRPKMFTEILFDFRVEGSKLSGVTHIDGWPGDATITDGVIEGDHISFTTVGRVPSSSGLPRFRYDGTLHGNEAKLTVMWGYIGQDEGKDLRMEMTARKLPL